MDCNLITFQDNMVLVEFPLLAGRQQDELEIVTEELLQTMFVQTVSAVYIGGTKLDLFGFEAEKQAKISDRRREREIRQSKWSELADEATTFEEMRLEKESQMENLSRKERYAMQDQKRQERRQKRVERQIGQEERKDRREQRQERRE